MRLSPVAFHHAFRRFQKIHRREDRAYLDSFRNPQAYVHRMEDYKEGVARQAERILDAERWAHREIGQGRILRSVIAAIEQPGNNLLQWDARFGAQGRVHRRLLEAENQRRLRKELEAVFFDLYARHRADGDKFEHLAFLCGKRYELIAYLFFIADRHAFLPIRTTCFDRAFTELGLELKTTRQCSWSNYRAYLEVMHRVRSALTDEGIIEPSLLDAHSFCWLLATDGRTKERRMPPRVRGHLRLFTGVILEVSSKPGSPAADRAVNDCVVDMQAVGERRIAAGRVAEEIALKEEQNRLLHYGRPSLARRVKLVSDRPGLGYDIRSFEHDGAPRHIEVKHIGQRSAFFLSRHEWLQSQKLQNYWFYLVRSTEATQPRVERLSADRLTIEHLVPTQYLVQWNDA
jgi:hypothetical protein